MSLTDLQGNSWRLAWLLEIGGVTYRWWGGPVGSTPPTTAVPGLALLNYTDIEAIPPGGIGTQADQLAELGGVSKVGGLSVRLISRGSVAGAGDPAAVLMRTGVRGVASTERAKLVQTIEHATSVSGSTIYADRSVMSWPAAAANRYVVHIGQETFVATGRSTGPDRFTGATRGIAQTRYAQHTYDPDRGQIPWMTAYPVSWRGRFARLRVAYVTGKALVDGDYYEVLRGIIDTDPDLSDDGLSVTVHLAPLTAVLKYQVGGDQSVTRLVRGWHYFSPGLGSIVAHSQIAEQAEVYSSTCSANYAGPGQNVNNYAQHLAWSDESLADGHPRRLPIVLMNGGPSIDVTHAGSPTLNLAQAPSVGATNGVAIANATGLEVHAVDVSGEAQPMAWPHDVIKFVNSDWSPGTVAGASGAWCDVRISADGPAVYALCNADIAPQNAVRIEFRCDWGNGTRDRTDVAETLAGQGYTRDRHEVLWYGIDFAAPDETARWDPVTGGAGSVGVVDRPPWREDHPWSRELKVSTFRDGDDGGKAFAIRGIADAYYQCGEAYFLAEDDILGGSGVAGSQFVQVRWTEGGEELTQVFPVSAVVAQANPDTSPIGYRYTVSESTRLGVRSFGDWPGEPRCEIRAASVFSNAKSRTVLLELLHSGRGAAANDATWDQLPFGANLKTEDVDQDSFDRRASTGIDDRWTMHIASAATVEEHISPILRATGTSLAMRLDPTTQRSRLSLVPVGHEHALDSVATITTGDLVLDGRPTTERDAKVITRWSLDLNFGRDGKPGATVTYIDVDAVESQGGDQAGGETIKLRGLEIGSAGDMVAATQDLIAGLRRRFGAPRLKYRFSLAGGWAFKLAIGDVVKLTAPDAWQYDGTRGVTALPCRITGKTVDWSAGRVDIEAVSYGLNGTGYAPALKVASVVTATKVTVEANAYTSTVHPLTGAVQADVDFFAVSDAVYCVPRGDWAGKTARTISVVSGNDVTLSGAHGLVAGDTIRPQPYDSVTAALRLYAYIADSTDTLGAGAARGYQYA